MRVTVSPCPCQHLLFVFFVKAVMMVVGIGYLNMILIFVMTAVEHFCACGALRWVSL